MNLEAIVEKFTKNPASMNAGAAKLARRLKTTPEIIKEAKRLAKQQLTDSHDYVKQNPTEFMGIIETETDHTTGHQKLTYVSDKPLTPKEIEVLVGVDNITTFVDRSWLKSHRNGTWTYSILTVSKIKNFHSTVDLTAKLKDIFGTTTAFIPTKKKITGEKKALFIHIADDHAGLILQDSMFNREYSEQIYTNRLVEIAEEAAELASKEHFSDVYLIRLGDEMDGYNGKTTRYDHDLGSASNKDQFDIYTRANKIFYDALFSKNIANDYHLISLSNSNHSGLGMSHMANKALEFWLEARYPFVKVSQQEKFVDVISYGNHVIALTHGKDEKYMKAPMPLNLDFKTDLWLMAFLKPYIDNGSFVSTIKGDIHKFNINMGKSGRYVNVPSISSGSNWIEHNFGDSSPGCLLEVYSENSKKVQLNPIWFD